MNDKPSHARDYVAALTGLRGVAALFVFLFHYAYFNPDVDLVLQMPVIGKLLIFPFKMGWAGVDLFFVLSGFLLTLPFAHARLAGTDPPAMGRYYIRRVQRVFPAYYAQLAIILLVGGWFVTWRPLDGLDLLAHLGMVFNIGPNPVSPMVGVWWTLPVELSFYLLLPWLVSSMSPRRWPWVLALTVVLSMLYRYWSAAHQAELPIERTVVLAVHLPGSLPEFTFGATAAFLVHWLSLKGFRKPAQPMLGVLVFAGLALAGIWLWFAVWAYRDVYWRGHWGMIGGPAAMGLFLSISLMGLYWGSRLGRWLFANPVVYFLGLISYSLYLWHFIVLQQAPKVFGEAWDELAGLPRFLASLALVVAVAALSYYLFERPFFRLRGRRKGNEPKSA